eukprot:SAG31_NODE_409_length_16006_cov_10.345760_3_plen_383_part_00
MQTIDDCVRASLHIDDDGDHDDDPSVGQRRCRTPSGVAESFAALLAEMTVGQLLGGALTAVLTDQELSAARELQTVLGERIAACPETSSLLGRLKIGMATKEFSKPDRIFKDRTWAFTNLSASSTAEFVASCLPGDDSQWWTSWLTSMAQCASLRKSGAGALGDQVLKMALFDSFMRLAVRHALLHAEKQPSFYDIDPPLSNPNSAHMSIDLPDEPRKTETPEASGKDRKRSRRRSAEATVDFQGYDRLRATEISGQLSRLVAAMNTAPAAKAAAVASVLRWVVSSVQPDIICLQEFNQQWAADPTSAFGAFWRELVGDQGHWVDNRPAGAAAAASGRGRHGAGSRSPPLNGGAAAGDYELFTPASVSDGKQQVCLSRPLDA